MKSINKDDQKISTQDDKIMANKEMSSASSSTSDDDSTLKLSTSTETRRDWVSILGLFGYMCGCFMFIVGSGLPFISREGNWYNAGSWAFFVACGVFCTPAGMALCYASYRDGEKLYSFSAFLQLEGSMLFATGSIPQFAAAYPTCGLLFYIAASLLYTIGAQMDIVQHGTLFGGCMPLTPKGKSWVPALQFNHLGGILFTTGSVIYFYPFIDYYYASACYFIGSCLYFVAAICTFSASLDLTISGDRADFVNQVYNQDHLETMV